jgi:Na+-driven multidrug efflux pump
MASFVMILHPRIGGEAAASVLAHVQAPLIGLPLGFLAVHYLAVPVGAWWSFAAGLTIVVAWNGLLWLTRRARPRIAGRG